MVTSPPGGENSYQVVHSDGFLRDGRIMKSPYTKANGPPNGAQHRLQRCLVGNSRFHCRYAGRKLFTHAHSRGWRSGIC
jgi:hypothetical protein